MTKQQFIERINKIEKFRKEREKIGDTLCSLLEDGSGVFNFGQELLDAYVEDTVKLSNISKKSIERFLYEVLMSNSKLQNRVRRYFQDDFETDVQTEEDLFGEVMM